MPDLVEVDMSDAAGGGGVDGGVDVDLDPKSVDNFLSKELLQLSVNDRNNNLEEIHGVLCLAPDETPEMLKEALRKLDIELDEVVPVDQKRAYIQSQQQQEQQHRESKTYVNTDEFRLRFLRAELFDVPNAARLMTKYLDIALEFFGSYALQRPVRLDDFEKSEMRVVRKGLCQFLPYRDRSGRRILVIFHNEDMEKVPPPVRIKVMLYMTYAAGTNDVDSQRKGIVAMIWCQDAATKYKFSVTPKNCRVGIHEFAPLRVSGMHICTPNTPFYRFGRAMWTIGIGRATRSRLKLHLGESVELRYALQSYGIPTENLPITWTGKIKQLYQKQWIKIRQLLDYPVCSSSSNQCRYDHNNNISSSDLPFMSIIECPNISDVIFRQGTSAMYHPGNVRFRSMIQILYEESDEYTTARSTKALVTKLKKEIQNNKGRVLMWYNNDNATTIHGSGGGGWWTELKDQEQIYMKIEYIVRELKFSTNRSQEINRKNTSSGTSIFQSQDGTTRGRKRSYCNNNNGNDIGGGNERSGCYRGGILLT